MNPENSSAAAQSADVQPADVQSTEAQSADTRPTLPLRGLAMVLIAVAVALALWGLYALTRDTDSPAGSNPAATGPEHGGNGAGGAGAPGAMKGAGTPGGANGAGGAGAPEGANGAGAPGGANGPGENGAPADAGAQGRAEGAQRGREGASADKLVVNVLNNSTVAGLAAQEAQKIEADGYAVGEVGNFNQEILPQTTVFFPAGDADAQARARELADRLGGIARENIDGLPQQGRALTVVLVNQ
ncbi:LytR C-terminal domain-containing protein [Corynebacterium lizhenjunii]|uniref:LytR C-terminal domain-containing protein n=1 Tax=Corynebacterium lizhenjunii TaxID=2709394 RepID=A0A7T0KEN9_9CORY|nr:LytR C-terminal domain-containing protein [Corynebacterium lizhenjunii]QPK78926.1 LytR C-terminal domain-containing protein [Corynebacterium lizhenjunii]